MTKSPSKVPDLPTPERGLQQLVTELQQKTLALEAEISHRKHTEEELRRSEQSLRAIIENTPECIKVIDRDGTIFSMNNAGLRLVEADSADAVLGRSVFDLIAPECRSSFRDLHQKVCSGEKRELQFEIIGLKGTRRWMATRAAPVAHPATGEPAHLAITRDITDLERADESKARLAAVIANSDDAIITKNLNGIITSWNKGAERIFGYTADETIGKPVAMLLPEDRQNEEPGILARLRRGERIDHYETVRQRKDGTRLDISLTVSPIRDSTGQIIGASKIARDITELRKARELVARSHQELEQRVAERTASLTQAVAQMEEFSYSVSHDLRAPVRAMQGYARAILEDYGDKLDKTGRDYLNHIIRSGARMDRLVLDILTYSRLVRAELALEPVNLDTLLRDIISHYPEMQAPSAKMVLDTELGKVLAHEPSLTQAISNLLSNAVKFVAPGVIPFVRVHSEIIASPLADGGGQSSNPNPNPNHNPCVRLWIEDNGIGINPEHQSRLFGLFQRIHPEEKYAGTGVGLAVVRKSVERMGGSVGFESMGDGSRFWIQLPAANPP